jgi:ankyrin repeat protein
MSLDTFEAAVDAIVTGQLETLRRLLAESPQLIVARSPHAHQATLLHYVAANGVEQERQHTPANIVEITALLLDAGVDIHAVANIYGGSTTFELAATSVHPERAGVQSSLLTTLLDHGARISPGLVRACLANGRGQAAEFLAARGAPLNFAEAAALGHFAHVESTVASTTRRQREHAFLYACQYGRNEVIQLLLANGVSTAAHDHNGQTGLHWAVIGQHLDTVELLLKHNPPLAAVNAYGGTAVGQAHWSEANGADLATCRAIIQTLIEAGVPS